LLRSQFTILYSKPTTKSVPIKVEGFGAASKYVQIMEADSTI
jgi:hypothetical protein